MAWRGRPTILLLLGWSLACAPSTRHEPAAEEAEPLDRAAYAERLAAAAGAPISVERLVELAAATAARLEGGMDELAADAGEPQGWRVLFERLRREGPGDEEAVLAAYREELTRAKEFTRARDLVSLPEAPLEVLSLENRSLRAHFPLALYHDGRFAVTTGSAAGDDTDYLTNHCFVCIPPLAVHEGYPGHHVAFARMSGPEGRAPAVAELARYKPFVEGWGLYSEALMLEQGYYREPERRVAARRMLLLRLLRAEVDARLHGGDLEPAAAEELYRRRLLLTPAAAATEVRTHLAKPTVKASYFVGMMQIIELRERVLESDLGTGLRDFHDRVLGPPMSVPRIARERFGIELGRLGEAELPWPWSSGGPVGGPDRTE